jgi:hypothetical protein
MNGQTGKLIGDLPVDKKTYWKFFGITAVIASIAATAVVALIQMMH